MATDDMRLVQEYVSHQSERAFATLVSRLADLVYSAALRQAHDPQLAEEVTQVVFVILARKAVSLNAETILPSWLYRAACYVARSVLKQECCHTDDNDSNYFDIKLKWKQTNWQNANPDGLKAALYNQLGLELVSTSTPAEILVIEKAQ